MIDRKTILNHLSNPTTGNDRSAAADAMGQHLKSLGCADVDIQFTEHNPTRDELYKIGMIVEMGGWSDYYSRSPDFIGLAKMGRAYFDDGVVEASAIEPRSILGLVSMLTDGEITTHDKYANTLIALDTAGVKRFWVGRNGVFMTIERAA